jgi:iron complex outermembrane receptor protein
MDVGGFDAYTPGDQYLNVALFTFQEVPITEWARFQAGIRLDSRSIKARYQERLGSIDTRTINADLAGSVGLNVRPTSDLEAGIQFAKAHRYPTIEELYSDGAHLGAGSYERGNPNLKTESGYGLDLFLRKNVGKWSAELAGYSMWIENFIRFEPTGEFDDKSRFPVFEYRSGSARLSGGEFRLHGQLGRNWWVSSSADVVFGEVTDAEGHPLPSIPPLRINNTLRYDTSGFWAQIQVKNVFDQDRVAPEELPTSGYALIGAAMGFQLGKNQIHRFVLRLDNALNTAYQDHLSKTEDRGQLMPGRNVSLIYSFDF